MNYNEYLQLMLDAALDIKAGNFDKGWGICGNLNNKINNRVGESEERYEIILNSWRILKQTFYTWPKFSGDVSFPIDDPYNRDPAYKVYGDLPKWVGEYGELRWELLDHVTNFIEKEIENAEHAEAAERNT